MTRIFRTLSIGLVLLAVILNGSSENTLSETAGADRPNIIFILTDDLDAQSMAFMPKLKTLLSDQGVSFSNFFVSFSLCCPSRATILRGQYGHNTQILANGPPDGGFEKFRSLGHENSTIATWLQEAGYRTVLLGKYLNGYPDRGNPTYVPPGWSEWYGVLRGHYFNYQINENGRIVSYGSRPQDYETDVLARKTIDFIQRTAKEGKPFFVYLAPFAPHSPATPAPRHQDLFPNVKAPRTPNFNEEDVSDKPAYIRNRPPLTEKEIAKIDEQHRKRLQSLQAVDEAIEALIEALEAVGQLDNTYIFFTTDNGFHLGNHRLATGKVAPYEEDIRVPLIVRGPGVPAGRTVEHLTGNVDLAPTWAELAGVKAPDFVDGRSLVPLLGSNPPSADNLRQAFLLENGNLDRRSQGLAIPPYRAIRTEDYLYVEYNTGERELYDLNKDPYQLQNLSATADPNLLKQLSSRLAELRSCAAASCRAAEILDASALLWQNKWEKMPEHLKHKEEHTLKAVTCWIVTVSDSRTPETDTTGKFINTELQAAGHQIALYTIIKNDAAQIATMLKKLKRDREAQVAIFHGGTGLSKKDQTARTIKKYLDEEIEGFGELFRLLSYEEIGPYALLSRAVAGVMNKKLIFSLPGSENAVKLAIEKLILPVLGHAVHELKK